MLSTELEDSKSETEIEISRCVITSDVSGPDDAQSMSNGEDSMVKGSTAETINASGSHRKRGRGVLRAGRTIGGQSSDCSHKVIEKRRRDRINRCLAELGKIIPIPHKNRAKQAKLEKAAILELTVQYIKKMQQTQVVPKEEPMDENVAKRTGDEQGKRDNNSLQENQFQPKYTSDSNNNLRFLPDKEEFYHQDLEDRSLATEVRPQIFLPTAAEQQALPPHNNLTSATSPKHMKNTLSVLRSRINSRTQEFQKYNTNQPKQTIGKYSTSDENAKRCEKPSRNLNPPEPPSTSMSDDTSSTSSSSGSESVEPQTDSSMSHSSDSGYRTLPRVISASPLAVNPQSFGIPSYALHPAGTHYIPVVLHPSIPLPPMPLVNLGANQMMSNGLSSHYGFGLMNNFNPMGANGIPQFGLQNVPFPNMSMAGMQIGQQMLPHYDRQSSQLPNNDPDVDVCSYGGASNEQVSSESIVVQTD